LQLVTLGDISYTDETLTQEPMAAKLTERAIKALAPPQRGSRLIWDAELTGFALRVYAPTKAQPKGARTFLLSYRHNSTERRLRIGSWPDWSVSAARAEAKKLRRQVDRGEDLASDRRKRRGAPTIVDLGARKQGPRKAEQSQHVADVDHGNLVALHHVVTDSGHPVLANHTVALSSLSLQPMQGQAQADPCKGVERNPEQANQRFLSPAESAAAADRIEVSPSVALPALPIPSWVPAPVARSICTKYAKYVHELADLARDALPDEGRDYLVYVMELLLPVVSDPRMRGVWQELYRQHRDGTFLHPARPAGVPSAADARNRQDEAVVELFDAAALACQQPLCATTTRHQAEQERNYYLAKAHDLECDTVTIGDIECCHWLWRAARAYRDHARETYKTAIWMAADRNHDGRARWVALVISNKLCELFGSPMYTLTATITSVVLSRDVKARTIRQWHPADCDQKNSR